VSHTILKQRVRQLLACDRNAVALYADLARMVDDPQIKEELRGIARDEARHVKLEKMLLDLLDKN
jgi:rubrerythrin